MTISPSTLPIETNKSFLALEKPKPKPIPSLMISKFFKDRQVAAACALEDNFMRPNLVLRSAIGLAGGVALGGLLETTGPAVAFHEIVGHGLLGWAMTDQPGQSPSYIVEGWENLKAIGHAGSFQDGVVAFYEWISGDCHGNNFSGETIFPSPYNPNAMGQAMVSYGQEAWISLAGSLPMLAFDTASVIGGMLLRRSSPTIGCMLVAMGLTDSIINSAYPISAAMMSPTEMQQQAQQGHDFANFAIHMSNILGVSAVTLLSQPLRSGRRSCLYAFLMAYLYTQSNAADAVPDALAVKHWLEKAETNPKIAKELERLWNRFPEKKEFEKMCQKVLSADGKQLAGDPIKNISALRAWLYRVCARSIAHSIPRPSQKRSIGRVGKKHTVPDRLQTAFTAAAVLGNTTAVATKVMGVFADTIAPSLSTAVTALTYASPLFRGASTLSAGYQVYKDFQCPDTVVPKSAKMLSVVKLIVSVVCAALMWTALFIPGLNGRVLRSAHHRMHRGYHFVAGPFPHRQEAVRANTGDEARNPQRDGSVMAQPPEKTSRDPDEPGATEMGGLCKAGPELSIPKG